MRYRLTRSLRLPPGWNVVQYCQGYYEFTREDDDGVIQHQFNTFLARDAARRIRIHYVGALIRTSAVRGVKISDMLEGLALREALEDMTSTECQAYIYWLDELMDLGDVDSNIVRRLAYMAAVDSSFLPHYTHNRQPT